MVVGKLGVCRQKETKKDVEKESKKENTLYTKINFKLIIDLNLRSNPQQKNKKNNKKKTVNLKDLDLGHIFFFFFFFLGHIFYDIKSIRGKEKIGFIKIENLWTAHKNIKEVKRQSHNGRKYLQIPYMVREKYLEYVEKLNNEKTPQFKSGKSI